MRLDLGRHLLLLPAPLLRLLLPKCSQWFGPCWKHCIYILSSRLSRDRFLHVQMLDRFCVLMLTSFLLPVFHWRHDNINTVHCSLDQLLISSVCASARETSLLLWAESRVDAGCVRWVVLCFFYQRLTGYRWGTKHRCSNVRYLPCFRKVTHEISDQQPPNFMRFSAPPLMSQGLSHEEATHKSTVPHIRTIRRCKCTSNLSTFYIFFQCNLFCMQD